MIRIVKLGGKYYGYDMGEIDSYGDLKEFLDTHISGFVDSGDPVLLVNDLEDAKSFAYDIELEGIQMVDPEEEE